MLERNTKNEEITTNNTKKSKEKRLRQTGGEERESETNLEIMLRLSDALSTLPPPPLRPEMLENASRAALTEVRKRRARTTPRVVPFPLVTSAGLMGTKRRLFEGRNQLPELSGGAEARPGRLSAGLAAAALLVAALALVAALSSMNSASRSDLETYNGTITAITANGWIVDGAEILVDKDTELHGQPRLGSEITCIAQPYPPGERARALEVWVRSQPPSSPTKQSTGPSGRRTRQQTASYQARISPV